MGKEIGQLNLAKFSIGFANEQIFYAIDNTHKAMTDIDTETGKYDIVCNINAELCEIKNRLDNIAVTLNQITK